MIPNGPGRSPGMTNFNLAMSHPFLTDSAPESDPTGNDGAFYPFTTQMPHYGHFMAPPSSMQPPFRTAISPYTDTINHRIPIGVAGNNQEVLPVSSIEPPFATQDASSYMRLAYLPNGSIPGAHHIWYDNPPESTSDAPGCASPTALQFSPMQGPSSSTYQTCQAFINDHPMINKALDCAKDKVASYPILKASAARRTNPAPFECDICKATFTRSHNLTYHRDAHFGLKKHSSICGKRFGTPSGSKRHEGTCLTCKASSSSKDSPSPA